MSAAPAHPAIHTEFETTEPQTAYDYLDRAYGASLRLTGSPGLVRVVRADLGPISVDEVELRSPMRYDAEPLSSFSVLELRHGWARYERDGGVDVVGPGQVTAVAAPGQPFAGRCGSTLLGRVLNLDPIVLDQAAAEGGPDDDEGTTVFLGLRPASRRAILLWARTVSFVTVVAQGPQRGQSDLAVTELARMVAHTVLATFPNTTWRDPSELERARDQGDAVLPRSVRRAVAFIESTIDLDVGLGDIAAAARVSPRALQYGFRRHLGISPMAYLRRDRLSQARVALLGADGHTTVTEVAGRWGFYNLGRFAADYRTAYGEQPRETLHRQGVTDPSDPEPVD